MLRQHMQLMQPARPECAAACCLAPTWNWASHPPSRMSLQMGHSPFSPSSCCCCVAAAAAGAPLVPGSAPARGARQRAW